MMSEARLGFQHSEESRKKMSEVKLGENNPMFGQTFSQRGDGSPVDSRRKSPY
jgi:hypothetical protein